MTRPRVTPLLAAAGALGLLLTGCTSGGSAASLSIDGEGIDLGEQPSVECTTQDGDRLVLVAPEEPKSENEGFTLQFAPADGDPQDALEVVIYADADGNGFVYQKGTGYVPEVTHDGDSYTVSGTGRNIEAGELPDAVEKAFEIAVTCP